MGEIKISNDEIFKEVLIDNSIFTIGVDEFLKIRIAINDEDSIKEDIKIANLIKLVMDIDSLPMDEYEREKYKRDIANIYQIGLNDGQEVAEEYANSLKSIIEKNLIIQRKKDLFQPSIIIFLCIIVIASIHEVKSILSDIYNPVVFGSIGGILSIIVQNNKLNIDYKVDRELLRFESFKLVLIPIVMSIIGDIAIKSKFILGNIEQYNSDYFIFLIYVICGYSQTFIPNILKNLEFNSSQINDE